MVFFSRAGGLVIVNSGTLLLMLVANYLANTGNFFPATVSEISKRYDTLFTPAGYAFSIWSLIFLGCIVFVLLQWRLLLNNDNKGLITTTGLWFAISNICNAAWLFVWTHNYIGISVIIIAALLFSLFVIVIRLRMELDDVPVRTIFFVWWPITIYAGWVLVATIACTAAWLVSINWNTWNLSGETWSIILLVIATFLYLMLLRNRNMREAAFVGVWAFVAIAVRQWEVNNPISIAALVASGILITAIFIHAYRNRQYNVILKLKRSEWK